MREIAAFGTLMGFDPSKIVKSRKIAARRAPGRRRPSPTAMLRQIAADLPRPGANGAESRVLMVLRRFEWIKPQNLRCLFSDGTRQTKRNGYNDLRSADCVVHL